MNKSDLKILYSEEFAKQLKPIKDATLKERAIKAIEKIIENPLAGKPLRYGLIGKRSLRVSPFRIVYEYRENAGMLVFHSFGHRKTVYD